MSKYSNVLEWDVVAREILEHAKRLTTLNKPHIFLADQIIYVCTHRSMQVRQEAAKHINLTDYFLNYMLYDRTRNVRYLAVEQIKRRRMRTRIPAYIIDDLVEAGLLTSNGRLRPNSAVKKSANFENASN